MGKDGQHFGRCISFSDYGEKKRVAIVVEQVIPTELISEFSILQTQNQTMR
jgi:predicted regulator of amino acid metabolism with ACT domain